MIDDETFRVWVGCLACYNDGLLHGSWYDAENAPETMAEFDKMMHKVESHSWPGHEELWCFDTENSPVSGEMSPMDARRYAEMIEDLEIPIEPLAAWIDNQHGDTDEAVEKATEAYIGDAEESVHSYYADCLDEQDLPEWARPYYDTVVDKIVEDARLNGEWYECGGHYFRAY